MALSLDRSTVAPDNTSRSPITGSAHQRRDMAVVWWSTYLSLIFLAVFIFSLAMLVRIAHDPAPVAVVVTVMGALTLALWALTIRGARRGVDSTTFRTRTTASACILGLITSLVSLWSPPTFGVGAIPLAFVLATSALSLARGRWWIMLCSLFLPAAHLFVATLISGPHADTQGLVWLAWVSFFAVIGAPTSLWIWAIMVELDETRQHAAELAIANERLRFAADLHDVQGHHLQVISLKTDLATRLLAKDRADAAAPHILEAHDAAQTALQETRALVQGYRKTTLTQELHNASAVLESAGVKTRVNVPVLIATWSLQPDNAGLSSVLGLTVREATTNILRHSTARAADFDVTFGGAPSTDQASIVELRIRNDGAPTHAMPTPAQTQDGSGLDGLNRRLSDIGGELSTETTTRHEFLLRVTVPTSVSSPAAQDKDIHQ